MNYEIKCPKEICQYEHIHYDVRWEDHSFLSVLALKAAKYIHYEYYWYISKLKNYKWVIGGDLDQISSFTLLSDIQPTSKLHCDISTVFETLVNFLYEGNPQLCWTSDRVRLYLYTINQLYSSYNSTNETYMAVYDEYTRWMV